MRKSVLPVITAGAATLGYLRFVGPWQRRWGATDEEVDTIFDVDALVVDPASQVTRAITIDAAPSDVWPWLVQIGADRAGFYSYDWLENLFGLGIHSADRIIDEWQSLQVGDVVAANSARTGGWYVQELRPDELLAMQVANLPEGRTVRRDDPMGLEFLWTFALRPTPDGGTRLLVRERTGFGGVPMRVLMAPVGLVSFVMTRRMMLGIKSRAETLARRRREAASAGTFAPADDTSVRSTIQP